MILLYNCYVLHQCALAPVPNDFLFLIVSFFYSDIVYTYVHVRMIHVNFLSRSAHILYIKAVKEEYFLSNKDNTASGMSSTHQDLS